MTTTSLASQPSKPVIKIFFSLVGIPVVGFALLNLAFVANAIFHLLVTNLIKPWFVIRPSADWSLVPLLIHVSFTVLVLGLTRIVLASRQSTLAKATFTILPLATIYATIGIIFNAWPLVVYSLAALGSLGVFVYLHRTKQPWQYYYSLTLISLAMLIMGLLGVDI